MGFDVGDRRIGLSVSDTSWTIASPVTMFDRQKNWQQDFKKIMDDFQRELRRPSSEKQPHAIAAFIVGHPILLNGDIGPQAIKVQQFAEQYLSVFQIPVLLWDERLSTHAANRPLLEADMSRAKRKVTIDKMSAVFILQGVLDRIQMHSNVD